MCTANRQGIFGQIAADVAKRNAYGDIVASAWLMIPQHFAGVSVADFVIMPNHFHGILVIGDITVEDDPGVGAGHDRPAQDKYNQSRRSPSLALVVGLFKSTSSRQINLDRQTPGH